MGMYRKDFIAVATALNEASNKAGLTDEQAQTVARTLADALADQGKFDRTLFLAYTLSPVLDL